MLFLYVEMEAFVDVMFILEGLSQLVLLLSLSLLLLSKESTDPELFLPSQLLEKFSPVSLRHFSSFRSSLTATPKETANADEVKARASGRMQVSCCET